MGAEFTPVFLSDRGDRDWRGHDRRQSCSWRRGRPRKSSRCRTNRGWTRSATPGSDLTSASTWSRSFFCCSTSSCCSSIPGRWPSGVLGRSDAGDHGRDSRRVSRLGLLGDHGLHRDPGGGLRLCVAERGIRMALGTPAGERMPTRPGRRGRGRAWRSSRPALPKCPRNVHHQARRGRQLVPEIQPLADAVRDGLLRHRADGRRAPAGSTSPGSAPR